MEISISVNKQEIIQILESFFIKTLKYVYAWLSTDGEVLGYIVGVYHVLMAISLPILAFISHTIYPSSWLKLYVFLSLFFVFIQHVLLNVCVLIPIEEKLTNQKTIFYPLIEQFLSPFNISISQFITYIVIAEGFTTLCFGLELLSYLSVYSYSLFNIQF